MKVAKVFGIAVLAMLAVAIGVYVRTAKDRGGFDFWKEDAKATVATPKIDEAKKKQFGQLTRWLARQQPAVIENAALAQKVLALNYTKPFPQPPYVTDTACSLYILDSTLAFISLQEKTSFAEAFNVIFEDGAQRSVEELFGFNQALWPTPAASALRELILFQIDSTLDNETRAQAQQHLAASRYSAAVVSAPTANDCALIPGVPDLFTN